MYMYLLIESYNNYNPWEVSVMLTVDYQIYTLAVT